MYLRKLLSSNYKEKLSVGGHFWDFNVGTFEDEIGSWKFGSVWSFWGWNQNLHTKWKKKFGGKFRNAPLLKLDYQIFIFHIGFFWIILNRYHQVRLSKKTPFKGNDPDLNFFSDKLQWLFQSITDVLFEKLPNFESWWNRFDNLERPERSKDTR